MKILLTGATGFIGSKLATLALKAGHQVAGMVLPAETIPAGLSGAEKMTWLRGTLEQAPWAEMAAFQPEVCVHTAWITTPGVYLESPENEKFRDASLVYLRRARELGVRHVVALGTCIEYQVGNAPLAEESTPIAPTTTYARCKDQLRQVLEADAEQHGDGFCWARIFYPYGPGEHPSRLCSSIIAKLGRGEQLVLKTPQSTKDYVYIDDIAAALLCLIEKRATGPVNIGTGIGTSIFDLATKLGALLGKPELIVRAVPEQPDPLGYVVADARRIYSLGWQPATDLDQGLRKLIGATRTA